MFIIVPVFSLIHLCYYKMLSFASEREYFILLYFTLQRGQLLQFNIRSASRMVLRWCYLFIKQWQENVF